VVARPVSLWRWGRWRRRVRCRVVLDGHCVSSTGAWSCALTDPRSRQKWADNGVVSGHSGRLRPRLRQSDRDFPYVLRAEAANVRGRIKRSVW
jgi:hypothetical protein